MTDDLLGPDEGDEPEFDLEALTSEATERLTSGMGDFLGERSTRSATTRCPRTCGTRPPGPTPAARHRTWTT